MPKEPQIYRALDANLKAREIKIAEVLRDSLNMMRGQMQRLYDKYAIDGKLTKAEMTKYNRYASMEKQMLADLSPAVKTALREINRLTPEEYQAAFFRASWQIDTVSGLRLNYGVIDINAVTASLVNEYTLIAKGQLSANSKFAIRRALSNGLAAGKSYTQMAKDLRKAVDSTFSQAIRIVRTEGQRAQNAGVTDSYTRAASQGVEGKRIWDATLDGDTRPSHGALDGVAESESGTWNLAGYTVRYPLDEVLPAGESANCRCRQRFEIEGYSPQLRRTREQGLMPYQTYSEWVKNYGPPVKRK